MSVFLHVCKYSLICSKTQVDEEFDTLKHCFDNVFNMLIFFAVKHVTHELRVLFRAIFQHNEATNYLFFQLEPFDCKIPVLKTDIPPPTHHFPAQTPTPNSKKRKGIDHTPGPVTPMAAPTTHRTTPKLPKAPGSARQANQPVATTQNNAHILCQNDNKGCYKSASFK